MEVMVANVHAVDREAGAVLPGVAHLKIAEPGVSVQRALLLLIVESINFVPTSVDARFCLDALVR